MSTKDSAECPKGNSQTHGTEVEGNEEEGAASSREVFVM